MQVRSGQNILDITLQEFGTLENLFSDVLIPNNININQKLFTGQNLIIENNNKGDEEIKEFYAVRGSILNNNNVVRKPPLIGGAYNESYNESYS